MTPEGLAAAGNALAVTSAPDVRRRAGRTQAGHGCVASTPGVLSLHADEHRAIGDTAFGRGVVDLGGDSPHDGFWLGYGDVMALSGDYFRPELSLDGAQPDGHADLRAGSLFGLARIPGDEGIRPDTRDEIVCALKVMAVVSSTSIRGLSRADGSPTFASVRWPRRATSRDASATATCSWPRTTTTISCALAA